ncbi:MAG: pilus assembly protein N-terminal domain-containing protein [Pseudobdellovibrionaceae bacterium]|jgi:Flp pilus assembly secretin CpaC|nr:pilus assembly protein N-terminal domain-containing protein [Pseudobdellovibrionaceae bacterium]
MTDKKMNSKKLLVPLSYACMVGLAIWGATGLIPNGIAGNGVAGPMVKMDYMGIEPASGQENLMMAQIDMEPEIPALNEAEIIDTPAIEELDKPSSATEAEELAPLRISPDKPEIVELDRGAVNVIVGSEENLRAVPDTNRTIILIPKKPGATYFKAMDEEGKVIMQRHVIIGGPKNEYIRIRRACVNGTEGCKEFSMYYCPDSCHEVGVVQDKKAAEKDDSAPKDTVSPTTNISPNSEEPVVE